MPLNLQIKLDIFVNFNASFAINYQFSLQNKNLVPNNNSNSLQFMKDRKASSSLSNLNFKKTFDNLSITPQLKLPLIRKKLYSQVQKKQSNQLKRYCQNSNIQEQYYKTNMDSNFKARISLGKLKLKNQQKFAKQIEEKMKRVIQVTDYKLQKNKSQSCMIMEDQSQIDQQFQQKILENRELLKKQRQNQTNNDSHKVLVKKNSKNSKKLSLLQNRSTNNTRTSLLRSKSKSLFPINVGFSPKMDQHKQFKNQQQLKIITQNSKLKDMEVKQFSKFSVGINTQRQNQVQQQKISLDKIIQKNDQNQIKANSQNQNKVNTQKKKTIKVIKIQNKLQNMKKKISQRKSKQQNREKMSSKDEKQVKKIYKINQKDHQNQRNNSINLFDNIQQFLANPHQISNKQLLLFERYSQSNVEESKARLQEKIKIIQQKLLQYHQMQKNQSNFKQNGQRKLRQEQLNHIQQQKELLKRQSTIIDKLLSRSQLQQYHQGNSIISDYGMHWHRYQPTNQNSQKHVIKKSSFDKELKYIQQLQQKNNQNLLKFIENQKLLHKIKLNKNQIRNQKCSDQAQKDKFYPSV